MDEDYQMFRRRVEEAGFFTTAQPGGSECGKPLIVCASQRHLPSGCLSGNSIRVEHYGGFWQIVTWTGRSYRIPARTDALAVLTVLLNRRPQSAYGILPDEIVEQFGLEDLGEDLDNNNDVIP